jgi:hypothetical protein
LTLHLWIIKMGQLYIIIGENNIITYIKIIYVIILNDEY